MLRFQCDSCGKLKEANETWMLGLAAQNIGITSARREISIASAWDRAVAVNPLAVHFCSDGCRDDYMNMLFAQPPETLQGVSTVTRKRVQRVIPGAVVDTMVAEKAHRVVPRKSTKHKKAG